jgi:hypothetical protein
MTNLVDGFSDRLPETVRDAAEERAKESKGSSLAKTLVLLELLKLLAIRSIDVLVLKGPVAGIYEFGHPALRTFADLDILVKPGQVDLVEDLLKAQDYKPLFDESERAGLLEGAHALEYSNGRVKVEIHFALFPRHLRFVLDESEIWLDAGRVGFDDTTVPAPSKAMNFLLACGHAAKHEWSSVRLLADAAQLLDRLTASEAAEVINLAKKARALGLVRLGVNLVREIFGTAHDPFEGHLGQSSRRARGLEAMVMMRMSGQVEGGAQGWINRVNPWLGPLVFWSRLRENIIDGALCVLKPGMRRARRALVR